MLRGSCNIYWRTQQLSEQLMSLCWKSLIQSETPSLIYAKWFGGLGGILVTSVLGHSQIEF